MKFNRISTAKIQESVDIERLIASQYPDNYLGMQQIQIPQDGGQSIEILKAYLGTQKTLFWTDHRNPEIQKPAF